MNPWRAFRGMGSDGKVGEELIQGDPRRERIHGEYAEY
jgi:hypothetical protein